MNGIILGVLVFVSLELVNLNENLKDNSKIYVDLKYLQDKIEDILNSENSEAIEKLIEWQSLLDKE